jgi:hypothetical protein
MGTYSQEFEYGTSSQLTSLSLFRQDKFAATCVSISRQYGT